MCSDQELVSQYEDWYQAATRSDQSAPASGSDTHLHFALSVRHRRDSGGCRRKVYVHSAAVYLPPNVALVLECIKDADDG
ncbi:hypothetical protein L208DRAFT_1412814 [Tricholoma matsutake]|nr:hypothetical protein L208DRAFT_1412814 [Tricholoma matsutake 945]